MQLFYVAIFNVTYVLCIFNVYNISAADAVATEPEEIRAAAEDGMVEVISDASEQSAEMSRLQGEWKRTRRFSFD